MKGALLYPDSLETLLSEFRRIPGIGPRGAMRIAIWLLANRDQRAMPLSKAIAEAAQKIVSCPECGFWTEEPLCRICSNPARIHSQICVVEQSTDVLAIEKTGVFRGVYHVLGGRLSPLNQIGPEKLRIRDLLERVERQPPSEVILALGAEVECIATANYLASLLREKNIAVSKIAFGLPAGGGLEHADVVTVQNAILGRTPT